MSGAFKSAETVSKRYADVGLFLPAFPRFKLLNTYFWDVQPEILRLVRVNSTFLQVIPSSFGYSYLGGLSNIWLSRPQVQVVEEWTARKRPEGYNCSRNSQLASLPKQNRGSSSSSFRQGLWTLLFCSQATISCMRCACSL